MSPSTIMHLGHQVSAQLTTKALGHPLYYQEQVSSTNHLAIEAVQNGAKHGTLFIADYQTDGYGRRGRAWISDAGLNLTFSVIIDLPCDDQCIGLIPLATCLGVADAIEEAVSPHVLQFKWPNDILLNDQKIAGILLQAMSPPTDKIILGIGINVNQAYFPKDLESVATSILLSSGQRMDRAFLMASVLLNLEKILDLLGHCPSTIRQLYSEKLVWIGQNCTIDGMNHPVEGILTGIHESGGLTLLTNSGTQIIYAGNLSLRVADH